MQVWNAWDVVAPVRPQLYLYSSSDALIPPAEVELFMKQQVGQAACSHAKACATFNYVSQHVTDTLLMPHAESTWGGDLLQGL